MDCFKTFNNSLLFNKLTIYIAVPNPTFINISNNRDVFFNQMPKNIENIFPFCYNNKQLNC